MAKVQGKKAAVTAKKATVKAVPPKAAAKKKAAAKPAAKASPKPKAKVAPKAKAVAKKVVKAAAKATKSAAKTVAKSKPVAKAKAVVKAAKKPVAKVVAKKSAKPAAKAAAKPAPKAAAKSAAKPVAKVAAKVVAKVVAKVAAKVAAKPAPKTVVAPNVAAAKPAAPAAAPKAAAKADDKKRVRRPRSRIASSGTAVATWFTQGDRPRPSSFIPAPPRAEAPSLIAAPPASSDRLVSHDELTEFVVRTVPVRVDIEQGAGRIYLNVNPLEVILRAGEGIEWDFRYLGGADIVVDDLIIDFEKPAAFAAAPFRSKRPGSNRPHRQLSGPVLPGAISRKNNYAIRALNMYKTELAVARLTINVLA
ncbi:MAG: hypothetical protein JWO97_2020 [Acidobacteria bacterium]|nr:hypothetical protein [Acidobacteriota bacterium]